MSNNRRNQVTALDAQGETGASNALNVSDFKHVMVLVTAPANASLTFKFAGSVVDAQPTFGSAQTASNLYDYVAAYDLQNPSSIIAGDTGVTLDNDTVANNTRQYLVNTDHLRWFGVEVTAYTDGSLTAYVVGSTND